MQKLESDIEIHVYVLINYTDPWYKFYHSIRKKNTCNNQIVTNLDRVLNDTFWEKKMGLWKKRHRKKEKKMHKPRFPFKIIELHV